MSKILVVEPHRMLQQAITLALYPDHEVKVASAFPEFSELKKFDAVIVNGASLGDIGEASRTVQGWKVPTVWIESVPPGQAPRREKLVSIQAPIEKDALLSALAECLGTFAKETRLDKAAGSARAKDNQGRATAAVGGSEVIELLDVVEEGREA